jgi:hypothetical protein
MSASGTKRTFCANPSLKLAVFCTMSKAWVSTGSLIGSSSLPGSIYRGSGTPHGARLNPHEMTIQNGFKPTQSLLPVEGPRCSERKAAPCPAVAGIAQPPRPMATELRTLQRPGGRHWQRRCSHARRLLAACGTFHSPDERGGSRAGRALVRRHESVMNLSLLPKPFTPKGNGKLSPGKGKGEKTPSA